ncbi:MAG TPA: hypothetical protein DCF99_11550 [Flavobacteriaceae bacterium]|nr:hypothetical protein [Flavobacteriaceae bacterium]
MNDINFRLSGQLLNDKKKVMDKKYVYQPGYYTLGIEPPKSGTYYVKVTRKIFLPVKLLQRHVS